jgi:hypothetical protein
MRAKGRVDQRIGADESILRERAVLDPAATVRSGVGRLRSAAAISPRIGVPGHVYDVASGLVETVLPANPADNRHTAGSAGSSVQSPTTKHEE